MELISRKIGLFGGAFDPVHMGHLILAQDAVEMLDLSEVLFIPSASPPHKRHIRQVAPDHRLNMLKSCLQSERFGVSDVEIVRGGISYTFETVSAIKKVQPSAELTLLIGSDTLANLHTWHNIEKILQMCRVASFIRPIESDLTKLYEKMKLPDNQKKLLRKNIFQRHLIGISSTDIRQCVAAGMSIGHLVPEEVERYIYEHGLYRE